MRRCVIIVRIVAALRSARALSFDGRVPPPRSSYPSDAFEPKPFFRHEIIHTSSKSGARVGRIHTPHGIVDTPGFVAVATNAALKAVDIHDAGDAGQQLIFANSYHLILQPGPDLIDAAVGLHKFMCRKEGPIITDSGGCPTEGS